jgi:RNA-directed DNA polymerase
MVKAEMWRRMHQPIHQQGKWLGYVVRGYFNYHAVPMNFRSLVTFRTEIAKRWRRALSRRSERGGLNWAQMDALTDQWLPRPRILHPWPSLRCAVSYSR